MKKVIVSILLFSACFWATHSYAQSKKLAAEMIQQSLLESKGPSETKQTLDPRLFFRSPFVKNTYVIAREIPQVLDKIFCYCYCSINPKVKHKSLLSCYTDNHASVCGICMKEAMIAKEMTDEGKTPEQIAIYLKERYLENKHTH